MTSKRFFGILFFAFVVVLFFETLRESVFSYLSLVYDVLCALVIAFTFYVGSKLKL